MIEIVNMLFVGGAYKQVGAEFFGYLVELPGRRDRGQISELEIIYPSNGAAVLSPEWWACIFYAPARQDDFPYRFVVVRR